MEYDELTGIDGSKYTIMIVDDIPLNTRLLEKILEKAEFQLKIFNDSRSALNSFAEVNPDILLIDVMMPGVDGFSLSPASGQITISTTRELYSYPP